MKLISSLAAAVVLASTFAASTGTPAFARAYCVYSAKDTSGRKISTAGTHRKKMSKACERARKKCNWQREYWGKRAKFGRSYGCKKIASAHQ